LKSWSREERLNLKAKYNLVPIEELAEQLDRSVLSIRKQVHYLRKRGWTFHRVGDI